MSATIHKPYEITVEDDKTVLLRFPTDCRVPRLKIHEDELSELVSTYVTVKYDLSDTKVIGTDWLHWIARLTIEAEEMAKSMVCIGMSDEVKKKSDLIAIFDDLRFLEQSDDYS